MRKTFLSEAESGTYWRRKHLSPAEGRLRRKTFVVKAPNLFINDIYTEKLSLAMPREGRLCRKILLCKAPHLFINDFYTEKLSSAKPKVVHTGEENP